MSPPPAGRGRTVKPSSFVPPSVDLPETLRYRLKNRLLGPPLASEKQASERLGRPTALAVLSSDVISSSAYATEQMLLPLVPVIGVAAFSLVVPVSLLVIFVLLFVTLSYLEVVRVYTKAGGAYVVSRENFGLKVAQVAAVSLLIDYTLTVAVSVAAGVAALTSVFSSLTPYTTWIAIGLVILLAWGNLRGIREAGKVFALPTYFFVVNMAILIILGSYKEIVGTLHVHKIAGHPGSVSIGHPGSGLLLGASAF
ncbi:MAG TPA: amino acid permease, partial [Acidimicrobiales bacterium]|nr:amino acid permease [Acidimicrobiales bacterium]